MRNERWVWGTWVRARSSCTEKLSWRPNCRDPSTYLHIFLGIFVHTYNCIIYHIFSTTDPPLRTYISRYICTYIYLDVRAAMYITSTTDSPLRRRYIFYFYRWPNATFRWKTSLELWILTLYMLSSPLQIYNCLATFSSSRCHGTVCAFISVHN